MTEKTAKFEVGQTVVIHRKQWGKAVQADVEEPEDRLFRIEHVGNTVSVLSANDRKYFGVWVGNGKSETCKGLIYESWISVGETRALEKEAAV